MRRKACIGKGRSLSLRFTWYRLQFFGNLCDIRARRASVCSPSSRKQHHPHSPPGTNPHKPTTSNKLHEHTKSRRRKIPAPSRRDIAACIAEVKRRTREGSKF